MLQNGKYRVLQQGACFRNVLHGLLCNADLALSPGIRVRRSPWIACPAWAWLMRIGWGQVNTQNDCNHVGEIWEVTGPVCVVYFRQISGQTWSATGCSVRISFFSSKTANVAICFEDAKRNSFTASTAMERHWSKTFLLGDDVQPWIAQIINW